MCQVIKSKKKHKKYGKIIKIIFEDGGGAYISKKGWTLTSPKKEGKELADAVKKLKKTSFIELTIPFEELNVIMIESIKSGYAKVD